MKKAVIVGQPGSVFVIRMARFLQAAGFEMTIVDRLWSGPATVDGDLRVVATRPLETGAFRQRIDDLDRQLGRIEQEVRARENERYLAALWPSSQRSSDPSFGWCLLNAVSIPPVVDEIDPDLVVGQEVFAYGLAAALCGGRGRALMPWGMDVHHTGLSTSVAEAMVTTALRRADLIIPTSRMAAAHIAGAFGVPMDKIRPISWGVDGSLYRRAGEAARARFCERFGLPAGARIVLNSRRFHPAWGGDTALGAFLKLAEERSDVACFLLGNSGGDAFVSEARKLIATKGLQGRVILFDRHLTDEEVCELFRVADVFTSLVRQTDMRSASILQGAACGAIPVLSDTAACRELREDGLEAFYADPDSADSVLAAVRGALDAAHASSIVARNLHFVREQEDAGRQQALLVRTLEGCMRPEKVRPRGGPLRGFDAVEQVLGSGSLGRADGGVRRFYRAFRRFLGRGVARAATG